VIGIGARVGPYEITGVLGAGGMGEVFRAHDTKLRRDVAIKVLPESVATDPERRARFEREAQVLASLNHPNIGGIHGFEEVPADAGPPTQALILELVEGPTLADRIAASPIPLDEALPIARQVAEGLEAAHEPGVIHRDLKPANIKLRQDGVVKILDFGLAKLIETGGATQQARTPTASLSPTITTPAMTQVGLILGTASYMSPEQARGRVVDRRADVWAFGCVLYEMLTGAKAFAGDDVTDTIAAVVRAEPDWSKLPEGTPASLRRLLRRCLSKDVRARLADMGSARLDIADADEVSIEPTIAPTTGPRATALRSPLLAWSVAVVSLIALAALAAFALGGTAPRPSTVRFEVAMPVGYVLTRSTAQTDTPGSPPGSIAVSPDGSRIAFLATRNGRSRLWVRTLGGVAAREIDGTEGASGPFWSPDSGWIGFFAAGALRKVDVAGGAPVRLCAADLYGGGTWGRDNVILFSSSRVIQRVPASGGEPKPVTMLGENEQAHVRPTFVPDSTRFAYALVPSGTIQLGTLGSNEHSLLLPGESATGLSVSFSREHILFLRGTELVARQYDSRSLTLSGEPVLIATDIERPGGVGLFSSSLNGVLAYQSGVSLDFRLTWFDRGGRMTPAVSDAANYDDVEISPDDSRAMVSVRDGDGRDLWIVDLTRGVRRRFTSGPGAEQNPIWSPDQSMLVFSVSPQGIFQQRADGTGSPQLLLGERELRPLTPSGWSPDGSALLVFGGTPANIWRLPLAGDRKLSPFVESKVTALAGQFSHDGRWVSYWSVESNRQEVYVTPYPGPGERTLVSVSGGQDARWNSNGRELFYTAPDGNMMAVTVDGSGPSFKVIGQPRALFPFRKVNARWPYDVTKDGQRFLAITADERAPAPMSVVVNWTSELQP
jgi:Tol biopolymer transport system component